ncbi:hypothetical protein V502_04434 [Pseudogymnoascus sp. VKM F-4520 (FW-2644)]|nr:hypothetical protein V502_04434 [Pseudogymnoascus sp. VKM F-4520 (FW-2644)]
MTLCSAAPPLWASGYASPVCFTAALQRRRLVERPDATVVQPLTTSLRSFRRPESDASNADKALQKEKADNDRYQQKHDDIEKEIDDCTKSQEAREQRLKVSLQTTEDALRDYQVIAQQLKPRRPG